MCRTIRATSRLSYSSFGAAISGGGTSTSLVSATARGFVLPGVEISNASSNVVLDTLQTVYGTGTNAAAQRFDSDKDFLSELLVN
jgi:hypothetical protein